jgi:hypothetical protein
MDVFVLDWIGSGFLCFCILEWDCGIVEVEVGLRGVRIRDRDLW